jgi:ankyrin repeat protein
MTPDQINATDKYGQTPLHYAVQFGKPEIIPLLLRSGADVDARTSEADGNLTLLHVEVTKSGNANVDTIRILLKYMTPDQINATDSNGLTPLHHAVRFGKIEIIQFLLDNGADVDARASKRHGKTPLHFAAEQSNVDVVTYLLEHMTPEQINATDKYGWTPLHIAARFSKTEIIPLLLDKGADVDARTSEECGSRTPLHVAIAYGFDFLGDIYVDTIRYLLNPDHVNQEQNASQIAATDTYGQTPLHHAVRFGKTEIIPLLLDNDADVDARTSEEDSSRTPLHLAADWGHVGATGALLGRMTPEQINAKNGNGLTSLRIAKSRGYTDIAALIRAALERRP